MRAHVQSVIVALATFGVVTGSIVSVGLLTAEPAVAQQTAGSVSGVWKGGYISSDGSDVNTFDITLVQRGGALTGTTVEVNGFGDMKKSLFLTANIAGTVRGDEVRFTKTYDGAGDVSHSVQYVGRVDASGRHIRGTYSAEGATGRFEIAR
jgi:hypothetical protein